MTSNHVLGMKVVLADGTVTQFGGESIDGVGIGPDLIGLFVGSEGLFGIALEITLRLMPRPELYRTVLAAYDSLGAAGDAVSLVVASGLLPGAIEIMDRLAIKAAEASVQAGYPDAAALLIVELEGEAPQVEAEFAPAARTHPGIRRIRDARRPLAKPNARASGRGAKAPSRPSGASAPTSSCKTASSREADWAKP